MESFIAIINEAINNGHIQGNPVQGYKFKNYFKPLKAERPFFTKSEIKKLSETPC
jgi:hypothetical protein